MKITCEINPEFITNFSKKIKERDQRQIEELKQSKIKHKSKLNPNFEYLIPEIGYMKKFTLYDQLLTENGIIEFQLWILNKLYQTQIITDSKKVKDTVKQLEENMNNLELNQHRIYVVLKDIFVGLDDYEILDFLNLIEMKKSNGTISIDQLYIILCLAIAISSRKPLEFLYSFGENLFSLLTGDQRFMTKSKLIDFSRVIGVHNKLLVQLLKSMNLGNEEQIAFYEFEVLFFNIFQEFESDYFKGFSYKGTPQNLNSGLSTKKGCILM